MARDTEPLLARRPSSQNSQRAAEEDALLTGEPQKRSYFASFSDDQWKRLRETLAFIWAFLATVIIIVLAVLLQHAWHHPRERDRHNGGPADTTPSPDRSAAPSGKRNLIFMVSDGMGPSSLSLTRSFDQHVSSEPYNHTLFLDSLLIGQSRTRSSNSLVTDSAAGATAFSCGQKSYNGAISMLPDGTPCPSVMEAAKRAGYMTGVVVTTRVTDATPACFGAHVRLRLEEDSIAEQMTGLAGLGGYDDRPMDLILGGGRCHFLPNTTEGSCRADDSDVTAQAKSAGWEYLSSRSGFDALSPKNLSFPILGLFAPTDIPFELDRRLYNSTYPSLPEMARLAISALSTATASSEQGFFLMIEGSRIDHAGHINDPAAQVREVLAYDETVRVVADFVSSSTDTPTLMLGTSDHETGGLAIARQDGLVYPAYAWYPSVLAAANHSAEWTAAEYHAFLVDHDSSSASASSTKGRNVEKFLHGLVHDRLGFEPTEPEVSALVDMPVYAIWTLAEMISRRAGIGWSTHGHSAADVNIYSTVAVEDVGNGSSGGSSLGSAIAGAARSNEERKRWEAAVRDRVAGNRENTDVGRALAWWLGVEEEMGVVGRELNDGGGKDEKSTSAGTVGSEGQEVVETRFQEWLRAEERSWREYEAWKTTRDW